MKQTLITMSNETVTSRSKMETNSSAKNNTLCPYNWILLHLTDDMYYSVLITIIINLILVIIGTTSNIAAIITISTSAEIRLSVHNILLLLLAITDVSVSLIAQPLFCVAHINIVRPDTTCLTIDLNYHVDVSVLLCVLSFLTVSLICFETYFAIAYPLQHKVYFTRTRVLIVAGFAWVIGAVFSYSRYLGLYGGYFNLGLCTVIIMCLISSLTAMFKTWRVILARRKRISGTSSSSSASTGLEITKRLTKRSAKTVTIIVTVLILCYIPLLVSMAIFAFLDDETYFRYGVFVTYPWTETTVYLASTLDPFVYCYRNPKIRHRLYELLHCDRFLPREEERIVDLNNVVNPTEPGEVNEVSSSGALRNLWTIPVD